MTAVVQVSPGVAHDTTTQKEEVADGGIHAVLILQVPEYREMWSHGGFPQDFKGNSERLSR
jgi:hypothetical protein